MGSGLPQRWQLRSPGGLATPHAGLAQRLGGPSGSAGSGVGLQHEPAVHAGDGPFVQGRAARRTLGGCGSLRAVAGIAERDRRQWSLTTKSRRRAARGGRRDLKRLFASRTLHALARGVVRHLHRFAARGIRTFDDDRHVFSTPQVTRSDPGVAVPGASDPRERCAYRGAWGSIFPFRLLVESQHTLADADHVAGLQWHAAFDFLLVHIRSAGRLQIFQKISAAVQNDVGVRLFDA